MDSVNAVPETPTCTPSKCAAENQQDNLEPTQEKPEVLPADLGTEEALAIDAPTEITSNLERSTGSEESSISDEGQQDHLTTSESNEADEGQVNDTTAPDDTEGLPEDASAETTTDSPTVITSTPEGSTASEENEVEGLPVDVASSEIPTPDSPTPIAEHSTESGETLVEVAATDVERHGPGEVPASPSNPNPVVPIAESRLRANHENAKKSRGPLSSWGKRHSRLNALRHGQRASIPILLDPTGDPSAKQIADRLAAEFQPVTVAEQVTFDAFLIAILRNRRLGSAEFKAFAAKFPFEAAGSGRLNSFASMLAKQTDAALARWEEMITAAAEEEAEEDLTREE